MALGSKPSRLDRFRPGPDTRRERSIVANRDSEPARPNRIYKSRRCLNDISVLLKSRYGRSLRFDKAVICRMLFVDFNLLVLSGPSKSIVEFIDSLREV
jgi:hypothetical protein